MRPRAPRRAQGLPWWPVPGRGCSRSVNVRVIAVAAPLAPEYRLAITVPGRGVAAHMALLRGETRINVDDRRTRCGGLLLGPPGQQPPARAQDGAVQPGLGSGPVRQETAPLLRVWLGLGLAHHAREIQLLQHDHVV